MARVFDSSGREIRLGRELGRGGEGAVFEVPGAQAVAKLYLKQIDPTKAQKLEAMASAVSNELLQFTAWPTSVLKDSRGAVTGFTMPMLSPAFKEIHRLYSPKSRRADFPTTSFRFLVHAAANVARGFAAIHAAGHVIGDVNHGNVLVSDKATIALIDCDSYQVRFNGTEYLCGVGVPTYTPPELQNGSFLGVRRTPNHDCFGLAVLIFHLLFMGRHPFAGRFRGPGDMPLERAIEEHRFAFSNDQKRTGMLPPPFTLELQEITGCVASLFEAAFSPRGSAGIRPHAADWITALQSLEAKIRQCSRNIAHYYPSELGNCPWCRIEAATAVSLFGIAFVAQAGVAGFDLQSAWTRISAVQCLPPLPAAPHPNQFSGRVTPNPASMVVRWKRLGYWSGAVMVVIAAVALSVAMPPNGLFALILLAVGIGAASNLAKRAKSVGHELAARASAAQAVYDQLVRRWQTEGGNAGFEKKLSELQAAKRSYEGLASERLQRLQQLEKEKYQRQMKRFLECHLIERASIPGIGAGRKDILASYGIEDAYDVTEQALEGVPGFGPQLSSRLLNWRSNIERRFMFNSREPSDPQDIKAIEQDILARKIALEQRLQSGAAELSFERDHVLRMRTALVSQLELAGTNVAQARADARLLP